MVDLNTKSGGCAVFDFFYQRGVYSGVTGTPSLVDEYAINGI